MNISNQIKFRILAFLAVLGVQNYFSSAYGQSALVKPTTSPSDSVATEDWSEETYYEIAILRLERWVLKNTDKFKDPVLLKEIAHLKEEAENFAKAQDYFSANLWLETIWDLLEVAEESTGSASSAEIAAFDEGFSPLPQQTGKTFTWSRELITGMDVWRWRQDFSIDSVPTDIASLPAAPTDSTFLESNGNPFTGFRFKFDYSEGLRNSLQGTAFVKYSRDYFSGDFTAKLIQPLGPRSSWRLENRLEGTSYFRGIDLKYLQNTSLLWLKLQPTSSVSFDFWDEVLVRRYKNQNNSYPNYLNNAFRGAIKFNVGLGSFLQAGYRNVVRNHSLAESKVRDYRENRLDFSLIQSSTSNFSLSLDNELRFRDYTHTQSDSQSIFQDYWENDFSGNIKIGLTSVFGTEIESNITRRDYSFTSEKSFPDYLFWEIEPKIYFKLPREWELGFGFYYASQTQDESDLFADYYRYGPVFTLELFQIDGILFSLKESYILERYPNIQTENSSTLDASASSLINFYSDRNTNSLSLFLTWNVTSQWQLNILLNLDDDRHLDNTGDSQNTLIGMDVNYSF